MEWIGINLRRSGIALLSRLPHEDAIKLAWLVAAGKMSWPDINAALDATVKRAISEKLEGMQQSPPERCDAHLAHDAWQDARSDAEREIWARYHAQCDAFFAEEPDQSGTGLQAIEQVQHRERILDGFRIARDDALAELSQRLGPPPALPPQSRQIAVPRFLLATGEVEMMSRLDTIGFAASAIMKGIIDMLADEIARRIMQVAQPSSE